MRCLSTSSRGDDSQGLIEAKLTLIVDGGSGFDRFHGGFIH
jgi:hypothetical protein